MPLLRLGLLFSLLCAVAAVANAQNPVQNPGEQSAVIYSVTLSSKGDRCTRLPQGLPGKRARDLARNT
jgi:hypothetical protein